MTAPDTTPVMLPGEAAHAETLFATERDPSSERSTGRVLSPQKVPDATAGKAVRRGASMDSSTPCFAARAAGDRGPAAYYGPPIAPSFFAAFKAGRGDV
jgi:hypothetical protein